MGELRKIACVVQSPLQLINCIEFAISSGSVIDDIDFFIDVKENTALFWGDAFNELKLILGLKRIFLVTIPIVNLRTAFEFRYLPSIFMHSNHLSFYKIVCFGEFRSIFLRTLASKLLNIVVFVDDGAASLGVSRIENSIKTSMLVFIFKSFGFDFIIDRSLIFFSAFDLNLNARLGDKLINNDYSNVRNLTKFNASDFKCIIIGQPLEEAKIVPSNSNYLVSILSFLSKEYGFEYTDFTYIPHRRDSEEKIQRISTLGINIHEFGLPLELVFASINVEVIASAYSSALFTGKAILGNKSRFYAFDIRNELTSIKNLSVISNVYRGLASLDIPVVNLNDV